MTREEAIEILKTDGCYECAVEKDSPYNCCDGGCEIRKAYYMAIESLEAEVKPVVRGEWIDTGSGQECSICKEIQYGYDSARNYCANCGAEMNKNVQ